MTKNKRKQPPPCHRADGKPCKTGQKLGRACPQHRDKNPARPGNPGKLTQERVDRLIRLAAELPFARTIADQAGITDRTLQSWLKEGEDHTDTGTESLHAQLFQRWAEARGAFAHSRVKEILTAAGKGDVSSAKWLLTRLDPDTFGDAMKVDANVNVSTAEEARRLLRERLGLQDEEASR